MLNGHPDHLTGRCTFEGDMGEIIEVNDSCAASAVHIIFHKTENVHIIWKRTIVLLKAQEWIVKLEINCASDVTTYSLYYKNYAYKH